VRFRWEGEIGETGAEVVIQLPEVRAIEGHVVDDARRPVAAAVTCDASRGDGRRVARIDLSETWSDAAGTFHMAAAPVGALRVKVSASGFVTGLVDVLAGPSTSVEVVLEKVDEASRRRLAEIDGQIRALKAEIDRDKPDRDDGRRKRLRDLEQEAERLRGE
jgi:hypothetical protein